MAAAAKTQAWLAEPVKRIAQDALSPVYVIDVTQTKLDDISKASVVATPEDITRLGFKVAGEIASLADDLTQIDDPAEQQSQASADTDVTGNNNSEDGDNSDGMQALAKQIAYDLIQADKPLVIAGTSLASNAMIEAAAQITQVLTNKRAAIKNTEQHILKTQRIINLYKHTPWT